MRFENTQVMNFKNAIIGMRNPKNSWDRSDSFFGLIDDYDEKDYGIAEKWAKKEKPEYYEQEDFPEYERANLEEKYDLWLLNNGILQENDVLGIREVAYIGPEDMRLAQQLVKAGPPHRKFLRQIFVSVDITAPLYWYKEFDTYKLGTVANSTSTMHKLASTPITLDCFETDDYDKDFCAATINSTIIPWLEMLRQRYNETKDIRYWKELIRWLPEGWLQTRTWTANYENIINMCEQRKGHKLTEWKSFIDWAHKLPYASSLIFINEN